VESNNTPVGITVAILGSLPPLRGLSSYCFELVKALVELGKVEFISFSKMYPARLYPGGGLEEDQTFPALNHANLRVRRFLAWYNPVSWLHEALVVKSDLLHVQWWSLPLSPIYAALCLGFKLRRKPVLFTIHNVESHDPSRSYTAICRLLFKLGDHYIVHSESNNEALIRDYHVRPGKVTRIPHGPLDLHLKEAPDRDRIRKELGFSTGDQVILLYGAIRPYKGIETALQALAQVARECPRCKLLIAGKPWVSWERYAQLIAALGLVDRVVTRLQYVPSNEVYKLFTAADLVLLPYTRFEAQSGVGATALSFRKPMIVSAVGGLPDLVADARYVVPPGDVSALAERMLDCLQNPLELARMSSDAAAAAESMSWTSIARKTWMIYALLLNRGGAALMSQHP
jgi:glycosyltransferase involved in cell wall biosynthesis